MSVRTSIDVRSYTDADEGAVLELLSSSLGGGPAGERPASFFRWKHLDNPFGRSMMLVAQAEGRIVGLRAFMRWRFLVDGGELRAVRAVDTATHPEFQGRGIFKTLTLTALDLLREEGTHLVFNTPNEQSLPGYLKMGWETVGQVPIRIRVKRPIRFGRAVLAGLGASSDVATVRSPVGVADPDLSVPAGWLRLADGGRIETDRTHEYLRWRYVDAPVLGYRTVRTPGGLAFYRVRPRGSLIEATLADTFVAPEDPSGARRLLREVARDADVDHVAASFPPGCVIARVGRRAGYLRAPRGMTLVTRVLDPSARPDPRSLTSWALSLGDLEVF